jgi:hypothetical protein
MYETVVNSSSTFWFAAWAVTLIDSILLLAPGEFVCFFRRDGNLELRIPRTPFVVRNRDLIVAPLSFFARPFFIGSINRPLAAGALRVEDLRRVAARSRWLGVHCYVAFAAVAAGPILTSHFGLSLALLCVVPALYLNALSAIILIVANRAHFDGIARSIPMTCFVLAIYPILAVNLYKHIIDRTRVVVDVRKIIEVDEDLRQRLRTNLESFDRAGSPGPD